MKPLHIQDCVGKRILAKIYFTTSSIHEFSVEEASYSKLYYKLVRPDGRAEWVHTGNICVVDILEDK